MGGSHGAKSDVALQLDDERWVEPGSRIGAFPLLADQRLPRPSILLHSSANPRMDLVLLLVKDESASSASGSAGAAAPAGPPGMSAAQRALIQRMMAKRAGQPTGPAAAPEPKRGPKIGMELWRLGDDSSCVWSMPLSTDKVLDPAPGSEAAKLALAELEDLCVHELCWSPDGDRVAALFSLRRVKADASNQATLPPTGRFVTLVRTFSVHDGRICSTTLIEPIREIGSNDDLERYRNPRQLSWQPLEPTPEAYRGRNANVTELQLNQLGPLPPLPDADEYASGSSTANLMPHQLRMMQMGMQKPPPSFELPSSGRAAGRGPLAAFPSLSWQGQELGLIERGEAASADGSGPSSTSAQRNDADLIDSGARTVLCATCSSKSRISLLLDGSVLIGSFRHVPHRMRSTIGRNKASSIAARVRGDLGVVYVTLLSQHPGSNRRSHESDGASDVKIVNLEAKLAVKLGGKTHPRSMGYLVHKLSRLSHILLLYSGYALDVAAIVKQIWTREIQQGVVDEWTKLEREMQTKFGCDPKYELLCTLLTGRASPAVETLLLANLTEGVLSRLEQTAFNAFGKLKRLIHDSLRPALERILMCLHEWQGLHRYFRLHNFTGREEDRFVREGSGSGDSPAGERAGGLGATNLEGNSSSESSDSGHARDHGASRRVPEDGSPNRYIRSMKRCLDSCLALADLIDIESVTVQEFFRYCRFEKDRQERFKQDQQEPRLAINHDVRTVAQFIERGFSPHGIQQILDGVGNVDGGPAEGPDPAAAQGADDGLGSSSRLDLQAVLAEARSHLRHHEDLAAVAQTRPDSADPSDVRDPDGDAMPIDRESGPEKSPHATASTTRSSLGLSADLVEVVTQMGEALRAILGRSIRDADVRFGGHWQVPLSRLAGDREVQDGQEPSEQISPQVVPKYAAVESVVEAGSRMTLETAIPRVTFAHYPCPRIPMRGNSYPARGTLVQDHFIAFCSWTKEGDGAEAEQGSELHLFRCQPELRKDNDALTVTTSGRGFRDRSKPTRVLDYAFFDQRELVLLLRLVSDGDTGSMEPSQQAQRGQKRKLDASKSSQVACTLEPIPKVCYFVATVAHPDLCDENVAELFEESKRERDPSGRFGPIQMHRITELEAGFETASLSVNRLKRTVAVMNRQGDRILYLDLTHEDVEDEMEEIEVDGDDDDDGGGGDEVDDVQR